MALRDVGWLAAAYAIAQSRGQFHRLQQRQNAQVAGGWTEPALARIEIGLSDQD